MLKRRPWIAGLVTPEVLAGAASGEPSIRDSISCCDVLEIRYDLFPESDWNELAARVRTLKPEAVLLATIRLKRDGGAFENELAPRRRALWESLLKQPECADWFDIERESLADAEVLRDKRRARKVKLLLSHHDFSGIPSESELSGFAGDCKRAGADGFKVAGMSRKAGDCETLYAFTKKNAMDFEWFSLFAMGETGQESRVKSLSFGANLTYGALQNALAPGQIPVWEMRKKIHKLKENAEKS